MLKIKSYAKINLFLNILSKRENGYHNIRSILQNINLCDYITLQPADNGIIELKCSIKKLEGKKNLGYKSAKVFLDKFRINTGIKIYIKKNIPYQAGLGSASTNAAAVLIGLNKLFATGYSLFPTDYSLLGADTAFFLFGGGTSLVEGIGDKITPINPLSGFYLVLIKPEVNISTSWAYNNIKDYRIVDINNILEGIRTQNLDKIAHNLFNDFEKVIFGKYPKLKKLQHNLPLKNYTKIKENALKYWIFEISNFFYM